jgi:hypothetical protein
MGEMKNNNQLALWACDKKGKGEKGIATGIRVVGDKEGKGIEEGNRWGRWQRGWWCQQKGWQVSNGSGDEDCNVNGNKGGRQWRGQHNSGKSNGDGNKFDGQAKASRMMVMATATRGWWQQQRGWQVTTKARARAARLMVTMAMTRQDWQIPQIAVLLTAELGAGGFLLTTELGGREFCDDRTGGGGSSVIAEQVRGLLWIGGGCWTDWQVNRGRMGLEGLMAQQGEEGIGWIDCMTTGFCGQHNDTPNVMMGWCSIRSAKQDDNYGASNIVLPCPGS